MLDKASAIPLYAQLAERIKAQILSGEIKPGDKLKSEAEITETLKSRMHLSTPQVEAEPYNHVLENLSRLMEEAEAMKKATKGLK